MFFKCYTSDKTILFQLVPIKVKLFFDVDPIIDNFANSNVYSYKAITLSI